jgi:hypothetical protein
MAKTILFVLVSVVCLVGASCGDDTGDTDENGDGGDDCTAGDERCDGNMIQRCVSGTWEDWTDCEADGQECYSDEGQAPICVEDAHACDNVTCDRVWAKCVKDCPYPEDRQICTLTGFISYDHEICNPGDGGCARGYGIEEIRCPDSCVEKEGENDICATE